ncbi:prolipoprotein diacylglyceryl transferase family protein [Tepidibacillus fermentans]|uniref:Prolipoprotein diacylglyceryl transferase n=1 Tax=Tepidibacillus fermentans TaxID=1281767 RepID=A0A4R3KJ71_9BACI|nr:prolipoprotein diacylglyceryl transferase family protein [Tepidibacillus fermentans]TCS83509.1 prolipoprotein diacylglyceryl transferase [Tepidibacillus fermentans]
MFEESQIFQIGPIQLPIQWIILFIGLFIGTLVSEQVARTKRWEKEKWSDFVFTSVLIVLVIYKFGWIMFDLKRVIQNPQAIIWTSGTNASFWLGILVAGFYFFLKVRKERFSWIDILQFLWLTFTITLFFYSFLVKDYGKATNFFLSIQADDQSRIHYHPVNIYRSLWLGFFLLLFYFWRKEITYTRLMFLYIGLGFGLLIISIFDVSMNLVFGLTLEQWRNFILACIGIIGMLKKKEGIS